MIDGVSTSAPENEEHEKSAVIKKISRGDQITTVRQVTMSQLSCSNNTWACFYLKANASSYGIAQDALKEGKVKCIILHMPQAEECTCSKFLQLS